MEKKASDQAEVIVNDIENMVKRADSKAAVAAMMGAALAAGDYMPDPGLYRSGPMTRGTSMKRVGKNEEGLTILEDCGGRQYTQDSKGVIRRVKAKK